MPEFHHDPTISFMHQQGLLYVPPSPSPFVMPSFQNKLNIVEHTKDEVITKILKTIAYAKLISPTKLYITGLFKFSECIEYFKDQLNEKLIEAGWPQIDNVIEVGGDTIINLIPIN